MYLTTNEYILKKYTNFIRILFCTTNFIYHLQRLGGASRSLWLCKFCVLRLFMLLTPQLKSISFNFVSTIVEVELNNTIV